MREGKRKIITITPAGNDWWVKFADGKDAWYEPIALWVLCSWDSSRGGEVQEILPGLASDGEIMPIEQECEVFYLPGARMKKSEEKGSHSWSRLL